MGGKKRSLPEKEKNPNPKKKAGGKGKAKAVPSETSEEYEYEEYEEEGGEEEDNELDADLNWVSSFEPRLQPRLQPPSLDSSLDSCARVWQAPGVVYAEGFDFAKARMPHKFHQDGAAYSITELQDSFLPLKNMPETFDPTGQAILLPKNFFNIKDLPTNNRPKIEACAAPAPAPRTPRLETCLPSRLDSRLETCLPIRVSASWLT